MKKAISKNKKFNLVYQLDSKNKGDAFLRDFFSKLAHRKGNSPKEKFYREELFAYAGVRIGGGTDVQYVLPRPSKKVNEPPRYIQFNIHNDDIEKAEMFFDLMAANAHKRVGKNNALVDLKTWVKGIGSQVEQKIEKRKRDELKEKETKQIISEGSRNEESVFRMTHVNVSDELLDIVAKSKHIKNWVIEEFSLKEPEDTIKEQIRNKARDKDKEYVSLLDVDGDQKELHFSATAQNSERFSSFLHFLDVAVQNKKLEKTEWENSLQDVLKESEKFYGMGGRSPKLRKADLRGNKKPRKANVHYLDFDWSSPISKREDRNKVKKHFEQRSDGQHYTLYPLSEHAKVVCQSLKKEQQLLKFIIGGGNNENFAIREDKKKQEHIRLNSKIENGKYKLDIFEGWISDIIKQRTTELSIDSVEAHFKSVYNRIGSKIEEKLKVEKELLEEGLKVKEKLATRRETFGKEQEPFLLFLKDKIDPNKTQTRQEKLQEFFDFKSIRITNRQINVGSSSSTELSLKQKKIKSYIVWLAEQKDEETKKEISKGHFKNSFEKFEKHQAELDKKEREASYKEVHIPDTIKPVRMLDTEQTQVNRYFHEKDFIMLLGEAGTGKTFLATAIACYMLLKEDYPVEQVIITRPKVTTGNKEEGFLPGDAKDKMGPYLDGYKDNLDQIFKGREKTLELLMEGGTEKGKGKDDKEKKVDPKIIVQDISYIRGRSLPNTVVIVDECQNLMPSELAVIPRRLGVNSKLIMAGDITDSQTDLPEEARFAFKSFALERAFEISKQEIIENTQGKNALDMYGIIQLTTIRRSPFVNNVIAVDNEIDRKRQTDEYKESLRDFEKSFIKKSKVQVKGKHFNPS